MEEGLGDQLEQDEEVGEGVEELTTARVHPRDSAIARSRTLRRFLIFKTRAKVVVLGCNRARSSWRVLSIDRRTRDGERLEVSEDPTIYSRDEAASTLQRLNAGNASAGGCAHVATAVAIVGTIHFLKGPYLVVITSKSRLGTVVGHPVYGVADTKVIQIFNSVDQHTSSSGLRRFVGDDAAWNLSKLANAEEERMERRYLKMFCELDMSNDFFFSYTFALANHLQANVTRNRGSARLATSFESMFVWNAHLSRPLVRTLGAESASTWLVPLVHGFFQQSTLSLFGRIFSITLISRRSRFLAGTRYHKRGVSDSGYVANEVETEQIVDAGWDAQKRRLISSLVQLRGSVPLHWSQESGTLSPRPEITINRFDPFLQATRKHYERVSQRYGRPIVILSLIKGGHERNARESVLNDAMTSAVRDLNFSLEPEKRLGYVHYDFSKRSRAEGLSQDEVLHELCSIARGALALTGVFVSGGSKIALEEELNAPKRNPTELVYSVEERWRNANASGSVLTAGSPETIASQFRQGNNAEGDVQLQNGIVRSNCVDCLDRTNVAQCAVGMCALGQQLYALGLSQTKELDKDSSLVKALMGIYQDNGDFVAMQYGGSEAHHPIIASRRRSRELLTSMRRFYSNAYTDDEKQGAINLFLGNFIPHKGRPALWELSSDYYLRVHTKAGDDNDPNACEDVPFFSYSHERDIKAELQRLSADDLSGNEPKLRSFDKLLSSRNELQHVRVGNRNSPSDEDPGEINNSFTVAASFRHLRNRAAGTTAAQTTIADAPPSPAYMASGGNSTLRNVPASPPRSSTDELEIQPSMKCSQSAHQASHNAAPERIIEPDEVRSSFLNVNTFKGDSFHRTVEPHQAVDGSDASNSISMYRGRPRRRKKRKQYSLQQTPPNHDQSKVVDQHPRRGEEANFKSDGRTSGSLLGADITTHMHDQRHQHACASTSLHDAIEDESSGSNQGRVVAEYLQMSQRSFASPSVPQSSEASSQRHSWTLQADTDMKSGATSLDPPLPSIRHAEYERWLDVSRLADEWQAGPRQ
jgi:hypothetical protein